MYLRYQASGKMVSWPMHQLDIRKNTDLLGLFGFFVGCYILRDVVRMIRSLIGNIVDSWRHRKATKIQR